MRVLASAKKVAYRQGEKDALPGVFKRKIRGDFVETMCFLFDGILNSTSLSPEAGPRRMSRMSSSRLMTVKDLVSCVVSASQDGADEQDTRLLVTLNKFHQLRTTILSGLIKRTGKLLETDISKDEGLLVEVVDNMDEIVFGDYVKKRSIALTETLEAGILRGGIDWLNVTKPTGTSSFPLPRILAM